MYEDLKKLIIAEIPSLVAMNNSDTLIQAKKDIEYHNIEAGEIFHLNEFINNDSFCLSLFEISRYIGDFDEYFEVIGAEPMLHHVLSYLKILSGKMYGADDIRLYNHFVTFMLPQWNLNSPYLKEQPEIIEKLLTIYQNI